MALRDKTKAELIALIETDKLVVKQARQAKADLRAEMQRRVNAQDRVRFLESEIKRIKSEPPKVIEVGARSQFSPADIELARRWKALVERNSNGDN